MFSKSELKNIVSDRCNYSLVVLRPDLTSVMEHSRGTRADQFSSSWQGFSSVTVSLYEQTRIPAAKCSPGTYSTSDALGLPAFNDMTNSIWICAWCRMQTGDWAEAAARAAADSERLALLSYHKNSLFLPQAGICWWFFPVFLFLIPTMKCIQMDLGWREQIPAGSQRSDENKQKKKHV